jgi:hypothetical protein
MTKIPPFGCDVRGASAEQKREFFNLLIEASNRKTAILGDSNYYGIDTSGDWNVISSNDYAMEIFTQIIPIEQGIALLKGEEEPIKVSAREKLDEYAELRGLDRNQLIGWSIAADFAEWFISNCNPPKQ